jgi:hypothetical protein
MYKLIKKYAALLLALSFVLSGVCVPTFGDSGEAVPISYYEDISTASAVEAVIEKAYENGIVSDWCIADMAADGTVTDEMRDYVAKLKEPTAVAEAERVLIAKSAVGVRDEALADYICQNAENLPINLKIFGLMALDSFEYDRAETRSYFIEEITASQNELGGFGTKSTVDVDLTSLAICALAPYEECRSYVEIGIEALAETQLDGGGFNSNYGINNSNSVAVAITALCAAGVDVLSDSRFYKNGTALDALLSFKTEDGRFGYNNNTTYNALASEQAFRAVVALKRQLGGESEVQLFRFYTGEEVATTEVTTETTTSVTSETTTKRQVSSSGGSGGSVKKIDIRVSVSTLEENSYSFDFVADVSVNSGDSAWTAVKKALDENGLLYNVSGGDESIYLMGIGESKECMLSEFDNGVNSGWMYSVNGVEPEVSMGAYKLEDGDMVSLYYVCDYKNRASSSDSSYVEETEGITKKGTDIMESLKRITRERLAVLLVE